MKWRQKSLYFRLLSLLPFGNQLHHAAQRYITREWPRPDAHLASYRERARLFVERFRQHTSLAPAVFVEIGAGRDLALAISLRLEGVERVVCIDVDHLARLNLINNAASRLGFATASSWGELDQLGISYRAPADAADTGINGETVDCFCTSEVLEHIPKSSLVNALAESRRYLRSGGLSIHAIDYSDHFARSDPSISRFNFLKLSEDEWSRHNSRFQYVNRLRHSSYISLLENAGFEIVEADVTHGNAPPDVVDSLAPEFRGLDDDDLTALRAVIVARKS